MKSGRSGLLIKIPYSIISDARYNLYVRQSIILRTICIKGRYFVL
jgi:hypothetical protein